MPVAEKTALGWTIMSPGREINHSFLMFTKSSQEDYMHLCSLDVLGLEDRAEGHQGSVYQEFKEQLTKREDGRYETSLPWTANHPWKANTKKVLSYLPVMGVYAWTDSTVCLLWINGQGNYKQFGSNRVKKINEEKIEWRYVPTQQNPADIGSRGAKFVKNTGFQSYEL
jgi:hypothetical protein